MKEITGSLNRLRILAENIRNLARGQEMSEEVRKLFLMLATSLESEADFLKPASELAEALVHAGFRVSATIHDVQTVWCQECGRDSGYHYKWCSKANRCSQ